jgi:putative zinc finger/helix-turn-helix YgiT family protein
MNEKQRIVSFPAHSSVRCPNCESNNVNTTVERETFFYGEGSAATQLTADVPVRTCTNCGFQFTDGEAEEARHDAVCRHLRVLTPKEILELRKRYNMSRAEFAELTRLGEASLARWENGQLIQNAANDQLLFLLTVPSNMELLNRRAVRHERCEAAQPLTESRDERFSALGNINSYRRQAAGFSLRACVATVS